MNIRVGTISDMDFIVDKLVTPFSINVDVAKSLLTVNGCLLTFNDSNITGGVLMATAINDKGTGTVSKIIALYGITTEATIELVSYVKELAKETHLSADCAKLLNIKTSNNSLWYKLDVLFSEFKNRVYIDSSTYSYKYSSIRKTVLDINSNISSLPICRDTWFDDKSSNMLGKLLTGEFTEHCPGVYSFPFLSKSMCKSLLKKASSYTYETNSKELSEYQMPEVVLSDKDLATYEILLDIFNTNILDISDVMYMSRSTKIRSIQMAKYSPEDISEGNWHKDMDSDITLVVALNDDYVGGGTLIKPYGLAEEVIIPKLSVGTALLFRGKHFMHKGVNVEKGTRNILVFWTES